MSWVMGLRGFCYREWREAFSYGIPSIAWLLQAEMLPYGCLSCWAYLMIRLMAMDVIYKDIARRDNRPS